MDATAIIVAVVGSGGLWAAVSAAISAWVARRRDEAVTRAEFDAHGRALRGLLYGELERRCTACIRAGRISTSDLNDIRKYHYEPYKSLGGDGTIDALMERVEALPLEDP